STHKLGEVFAEMTFTLSSEPGWVNGARQPDVMFVMQEKYEAFLASVDQNVKQPFVCLPDLVVEVISPTDRYSEVSKKIKAYLADGVRLIWAVDMEEKTVAVYSPDHPVQMLNVEQTLTGGDVLSGFTMVVDSIFFSK
ncbi:MAG: Uma2 family endonuclease, partial [Anaerolineae bacterium]|nr:Uma2 family endonuclease [Anaerolineae bacterium]